MSSPSAALLSKPLSHPKDAGKPLPPDPHAVSVCLPTWKSVLEYAEADLGVRAFRSGGHPRFSFHPLVQKLFEKCEKRFAAAGERSMAFPSQRVAERVRNYVRQKTEQEARIDAYGKNNIFVVTVPEDAFEVLRQYWQYSGQIITSRLATATLQEQAISEEKAQRGKAAKVILRERIAEIAGASPQNVALFPTGIAPLSAIQRFLKISFPERKSVQFGFSYTDSLNIQKEFGNGAYVFHKGDKDDLKKLEELLMKEKVLGIFCELPGDPLLKTIDLERLRMISKKYTAPIIVDDTLGTYQNFKAFAFADIIVSSLSKFFSGEGNVTGGALLINPKSRFLQMFSRVFRDNFEDLLWAEDAIVLEENSRDFAARMKKIEATTEVFSKYIQNHPAIYKIFTPQLKIPEKEVYGCGGVFSFLLYNPEKSTPKFYDAVNVSKGPGFGTNFTLLTPYLLLNLFKRLDIVEKQGLSPFLLRVSVGLEEPEDLQKRFEKAFSLLT